jgi:RNA polymerase sigma factor (sigma-70 family)
VRTDGELLATYARFGAEDAFAELVDRHGPMVRAACERLAGPDAEDAVQAVFVLLARKARRLSGRRDVGSWLHGTCRLVARTARRERARRAAREKEAAEMRRAQEEAGISPAQRAELGRNIDDAVSALPERFRQVVVLCHLEGASQQEVADRLGLPLGTVATRSMRGLERLRGTLARRGLDLGAAALGAALLEAARGAAASFSAASILPSVLTASKASAAGAAAGAAGGGTALLVKGAVQTMFWSKVKVASALLAGALAAGSAVPMTAAAVRGGEPAAEAADGDKPEPKPEPKPKPAPAPAPAPPVQVVGGSVVQVVTSDSAPGADSNISAEEIVRCAAAADLVAVVKVSAVSDAPAEKPNPNAGGFGVFAGRAGGGNKSIGADVVEVLGGKCAEKKLTILATVRGEGEAARAVFSRRQQIPNPNGNMRSSIIRSFMVPFTLKKGEQSIVFLKLEREEKDDAGKVTSRTYRLLPPLFAKADAKTLARVRDGLKRVAEWEEAPKLTAQQAAQLDALIGKLGSPEFQVREKVAKDLIAFGPDARGKLREALKSPDAEVRDRAQAVLDALKPGGKKEAGSGVKRTPDGMIIKNEGGEVRIQMKVGN